MKDTMFSILNLMFKLNIFFKTSKQTTSTFFIQIVYIFTYFLMIYFRFYDFFSFSLWMIFFEKTEWYKIQKHPAKIKWVDLRNLLSETYDKNTSIYVWTTFLTTSLLNASFLTKRTLINIELSKSEIMHTLYW